MNFKMIKRDPSHYILELREREENGRSFLRWDFKKATHFLIIMADIDTEESIFSISGNFLDMLNKCANDSYSNEYIINNSLSAVLLDYEEYMKEDRWYFKPRPMRVIIYSCDVMDDNCTIFVPDDISICSINIPAKLYYSKQLLQQPKENKGFLGKLLSKTNNEISPYDKYRIKLSELNNYETGIFYKVSGFDCLFPITESMTGKEFFVTVPHGKEITFFMENQANQNYRIIELSPNKL